MQIDRLLLGDEDGAAAIAGSQNGAKPPAAPVSRPELIRELIPA